jgi:hypothetical protein
MVTCLTARNMDNFSLDVIMLLERMTSQSHEELRRIYVTSELLFLNQGIRRMKILSS